MLPTAALLNLSRPPLARGHAAAAAAAASYGASLRAAGGGGGAPQGKRYEGAPSNMFLLLDAEYLQDAAAIARHALESSAAAAETLFGRGDN